jgi:hypothetical protein
MARADGGTVIRTSMSPGFLFGSTTVDADADVEVVVEVEVGASFSRMRGRREQSGMIVRC